MSFNDLWDTYIVPLKGKEILTARDNKKNKIVEVTQDYLIRLSSNGKMSPKIKKELFAEIYSRLKTEGTITRDQINTEYKGRRSSIVTVILAKLPDVEVRTEPVSLVYKTQ